MAYRRVPNSAGTVIRALKAAREAWKRTPPDQRALTPEQWAQLDDCRPESLLNRLLKEVADVQLALTLQAPLRQPLVDAGRRLATAVSHFHQVLDMGIARGAIPAGARGYYGRDIHATALPNLRTHQALEEAAQKVIQGEPARQAAEGAAFVPMTFPSAGEIATLLEQFRAARIAATQARHKTNLEREDLAALYAEARELARDISDTVRFHYRKDPSASSRREKCALWGVVYDYGTPAPQPEPPEMPPPQPAAAAQG